MQAGSITQLVREQTIILPENRKLRARFERKLDEYEERLVTENETGSDAWYKTVVVERLLEKGRVDAQELAAELYKMHQDLDAGLFNNAIGVINDYCTTGGKNVFYST